MLADCREGLIQMIYFKSVSRLARNVTDLLSIVRELTAIGVVLIFEKENIRTDQMASDFLLSTMAIIAEFESTNISSNVRWGHVSKFARGTHKVVHAPYGYDKDAAGSLVINPSEAAIVREIFYRICAGEGCGRIAKDMEAMHVPTKRGGRWESGTIRSIVKNPAVMGTMVGQRYYIQDRKAHVNRGEKDIFIARRIDKKVAAAQLLLLHTCTALRFLNSSCDGEKEYSNRWDRGHSPLRDFEEFAAMEMTITTVAMKMEAMDLIDAVVVDGDEIRVRFKAGVEI